MSLQSGTDLSQLVCNAREKSLLGTNVRGFEPKPETQLTKTQSPGQKTARLRWKRLKTLMFMPG